MSLDSDRSPDGEPTEPAGQAPVPAHQAPVTTVPPQPVVPSFTPAPVPADSEPAADEPAAEQAAGEPESAAGEAAAAIPTADERTAAEPAAGEPEAAADEPTASELTAQRSSVAPAWDAEGDPVTDGPAGRAADGPADRGADADRAAGIEPTADLDSPLLSDTDELRASWQRIQAAFVDDPREAVADAAGLVEHTAQALVDALRRRQRHLRDMWDPDGLPDGVEYADSGGTAPHATYPDGDRQAADGPDTEQLRLLVQRYRVLFNHLCRP